MSYDLAVYAREALSEAALRSLLADAGLGVDSTESSSDSLTVVRGARKAYSFTVGLSVAVELEDIPDEVTAVLLGASCMYALLVEGSSPIETPYAVRFARRLADATHGAVLDQQTGQTWTRGKLRTAQRVEQGTVSTVNIYWYVRSGFDPTEAAMLWTTLARRHLPEALPRRYGTFEPLQHRLQDGGDAAFAAFASTADGTIYFATSRPVVGGHVGVPSRFGGLVLAHGLTLLRDPLDDPHWRHALQGLFIDFARETQTIVATAEVQRGVNWSGRSLSYGASHERTTYLAPRGNWVGLPPYPVWWAWFGPDYAPLVADHLPADHVTAYGPALFHWRSEAPADRDQLLADLAPSGTRRLFRRTASATPASWLPADLLPVDENDDPRLYNPPLTAAQVRPASLS